MTWGNFTARLDDIHSLCYYGLKHFAYLNDGNQSPKACHAGPVYMNRPFQHKNTGCYIAIISHQAMQVTKVLLFTANIEYTASNEGLRHCWRIIAHWPSNYTTTG